jgi:hypothetical protein
VAGAPVVRHGHLAGPIDRYLPVVVLGYFVSTIAGARPSHRRIT